MRALKIRSLWLLMPFVLTGCGVAVQNMTPQAFTRNPSGLYPVSVEVTRNNNSVLAGSIQPMLVLPNTSVEMLPNPNISNRWEYTIAVPANATEWPYYFKVNYRADKAMLRYEPRSQMDPEDAPKRVYVLRISDRTAVGLDARRGRIGSTIKVLGRGFTAKDKVLFGGTPVGTKYENENTLSFQIPAIAPNRTYVVEVEGGGGRLKFGDILVDTAEMVVTEAEVRIPLDTSVLLPVQIPAPAPTGGVKVTIENSDPSILAAPKTALIPAGQNRVDIKLTGNHLGTGQLTITAEGFNPTVTPFRIPLR